MPKQPKPYPEFPLTAHRNGQWCKKIRGKIHYFGSDLDKALAKYLDEVDDLQAGRQPRRQPDSVTTEYLVNAFIHDAAQRVERRDLSPLSLIDYRIVGALVLKHLGRTTDPTQLTPDDFTRFRDGLKWSPKGQKARPYSPSRVSKIITVTRGIFRWGSANKKISRMVEFGSNFKVASRKAMRRHRKEQGKKLLTAEEIRELLAVVGDQGRAILLLCINCGFGNTDIATLRVADVGGAWLDFPRPKTEIDRRIPLWSETQEAIAPLIEGREPGELLFRSKHGGPLIDVRPDGKRTDLTQEWFRRIATKAGIIRPKMGLYWIRHTFQTVADEARDPIATSSIMGHADGTMAGQYREGISDGRLLLVVNHVRDWLFTRNEEREAASAVSAS